MRHCSFQMHFTLYHTAFQIITTFSYTLYFLRYLPLLILILYVAQCFSIFRKRKPPRQNGNSAITYRSKQVHSTRNLSKLKISILCFPNPLGYFKEIVVSISIFWSVRVQQLNIREETFITQICEVLAYLHTQYIILISPRTTGIVCLISRTLQVTFR